MDGMVKRAQGSGPHPRARRFERHPAQEHPPLRGFPLIAWSIAAALQAETVTRTIVCTDDEEIAAVAREWGAETPFLRPAEFAQDKTTDLPVFEHALKWLAENENYHPEVVVQLRPTSPIRPRDCVDDAVRMLLGSSRCGQRARGGSCRAESAQDVAAASE